MRMGAARARKDKGVVEGEGAEEVAQREDAGEVAQREDAGEVAQREDAGEVVLGDVDAKKPLLNFFSPTSI